MSSSDDVIVVASKGHQVLVNVKAQPFLIDSYTPVNLSKLFDADTLDKCSSLRSHLEDGHLVYYTGGNLPENLNAPKIEPLREVTAEKFDVSYDQSSEGAREDVHLSTVSNVSEQMKTDIQTKVVQSKEESLQVDRQSLKAVKGITEGDVVEGPVRQRSTPLTPEELSMTVTMDVPPEKFKADQEAQRLERANRKKVNTESVVDENK